MPNPKAWKLSDPQAPSFPQEYEVVKKATLQKTDLRENNNKYYGVELHKAHGAFRVFTHYGRTGDLVRNPDAGMKECRFFDTIALAEREYNRLFKAKTSKRKGYVELSLASSNIGSDKARGTSSGHVDEETREKIKPNNGKPTAPKPVNVCPPGVRDLISLIYNEATTALTNTVQATITAKGIETPLGVLTMGQIEVGQLFLKDIFTVLQTGLSKEDETTKLQNLSSQFYTAIPHRLGRTKTFAQAAIIDSKQKVSEKEETLQLMRDMLTVDGEGGGSILVSDHLGDKYKALGCGIEQLPAGGPTYMEWSDYVLKSRVKHRPIHIQNIYRLARSAEGKKFDSTTGNTRQLFHGSRIKNWVGLLTRGTLMPKLVVAMGGNRTDGGWLGNGIYFGDTACTSSFYTSPGRGGRRLMSIHSVALGRMKEFKKITYGLNEPPKGFNSCHGDPRGYSEFSDDEFCIYNERQQHMHVLVEFTT